MARDRNRPWKKQTQRRNKQVVTRVQNRATMQLLQVNKKHNKYAQQYCPDCSELWVDCWCNED